MNRTNNFKKVEKSVFVYIVNVLSLIKKFLSSIVGFFINSGSQKITIMMIPHNEKRVFNFKLNVFALFIIFLFTSSGLGIILFLTVANFNTSLKYKDASIKTQINEKRSREYEELLNEILDNHNIFKGKLNVLMSKLSSNSLQNIMDDEYFKNQGGAPNLVDFSGLDEFERERAEVDRLLGDYRKSIIAFSEINKMADNYNKILKDMP
ncbi:MAG TPA: hypothetical protein PLI57_11820, partial [Spirochaetota bacterium]|nr:hypothetical protein [Spirochaetota bacterium]